MAMTNVFSRRSHFLGAFSKISTLSIGISLVGISSSCPAAGVDAQLVAKGLARAAKQADAEYDKVDPKDVATCSGSFETRNGVRGLLISAANGQPLRWLADTNGDGPIDLFSFYSAGVEVYRDIDSDFDGKIDQSRWMGTAGLRWGIDKDQDGTLDYWKMISAEEVTAEVVKAVRDEDMERFQRLLMTRAELKEIGLGNEKSQELAERIDAAVEEFKKLVRSQKAIDKSSRWASFGADKPGIVPAGTADSTEDIMAYENAMAIVETAAGPQQLMVGTLVRVGESWRLLDVPRLVSEGSSFSENGLFSAASSTGRASASGASGSAISATLDKLLKEVEALDAQLKDPKSNKAQLHAQKADLWEQVIANSTSSDAEAWTRQMADQILSAVQSGEYPDGIKRLKKLEANLQSSKDTRSEVSYVSYRILDAEYNEAVSGKNVNYEKVQEEHLKRLEDFVSKYPKSIDSADAMIQLGLNSELMNDLKAAEQWYKRTAANFPSTPQGDKAEGAVLRMNLEGQEVSFAGTTLNGKKFSTAKIGKPVLVHYWDSNCGPCKADMLEFRKLQSKYAKKGLTIVGINTDRDSKRAIEFLQANKDVDWVQLHEPGGLDSKIASGLGVFSLPVTILIDKDGKVAKSTYHYTPNLEGTIEGMLR